MGGFLRILAAVFLVFFPARYLTAETIVLSTGEYAPYNSQNFKHFGLVPKIVTEAFARGGIEVEYRFYPWARAYELSKNGEVDGTCQWLASEKRARDHFYSDKIMYETTVWFHLKANPLQWDRLEDLRSRKIGAIKGFTYNAAFYEAIRKGVLHVEFVTDEANNYKN